MIMSPDLSSNVEEETHLQTRISGGGDDDDDEGEGEMTSTCLPSQHSSGPSGHEN